MTRTSSLRKLIVMVMCVAMMLSVLAINALAADPGDKETSLYQAGQYDPDYPALHRSMGDPSILGSDVSYNDVTDKTTVTVYVEPMTAYGTNGYIKALTLTYGLQQPVIGTPGADISTGPVGTPPYYIDHPPYFTFEFSGQINLVPPAVFVATPTITLIDSEGEEHDSPVSATLVIFNSANTDVRDWPN